jgi:hypothetical protein
MAQDFTSFLMAQQRKPGLPIAQGFGGYARERLGPPTPAPAPAPSGLSMAATVRPDAPATIPLKPSVTAGGPLVQAATVRPDAPVGGPLKPPGPMSVSDRFLEFARQRQAARAGAQAGMVTNPVAPVTPAAAVAAPPPIAPVPISPNATPAQYADKPAPVPDPEMRKPAKDRMGTPVQGKPVSR